MEETVGFLIIVKLAFKFEEATFYGEFIMFFLMRSTKFSIDY